MKGWVLFARSDGREKLARLKDELGGWTLFLETLEFLFKLEVE